MSPPKAEYYLRMLGTYGELPKESQWELAYRLDLIEREIGYSKEYISVMLQDLPPEPWMPLRQFTDRINVVQSIKEVAKEVPIPEDFIKQELVHGMVNVLVEDTKFTKRTNSSIWHDEWRARLYIFKGTDDDV